VTEQIGPRGIFCDGGRGFSSRPEHRAYRLAFFPVSCRFSTTWRDVLQTAARNVMYCKLLHVTWCTANCCTWRDVLQTAARYVMYCKLLHVTWYTANYCTWRNVLQTAARDVLYCKLRHVTWSTANCCTTNVQCTGCPTTYQTQQFFNNSKTNEDIARDLNGSTFVGKKWRRMCL
jgi:hypothetical protein